MGRVSDDPTTGEAAPLDPAEAAPRPRAIQVAAGVVFAEAAALLAVAMVDVVALDGGRLALGLTNIVFFLLYAAGLAWCGWGLLRLRRWSRSPIVMTQIIQLGVAYSFYGNSTVWLAAVLAVAAIVVLVVVFSPSTTVALYGRRGWSVDEDA